MIKVNDISLDIGEKKVFSNLNFSIDKPEMVAITGVSGSGDNDIMMIVQ